MKIILNNREEMLPGETLTVSEMLLLKKFSFKMRIIKINGVLVPKDKYDSTLIKEGDNVQMLYLMSGG
ncbi:MAG: thiamine biosynthesis protein ThiS [Bacteroidales bacterium]|jgi:thiamine biosynthesis protein ThiS|nr:thiamine biosynthesis protein ThiS [Bacteroidales bacterium]OQB61910.1 MAG: sulfur carrier protein ThiS [Bacteroidetes bacterium ADurb.Bin145]HOU01878.1 sulfur carrier protein ThiS [Bacteroidales bacterium]HQK67348.1 sulfur carrier protein ThiS [Bacteroidales bacterium]